MDPARPFLVFDLDGTLVDSAPDLVDALNTILRREGIASLPIEQARKYVGHGGRMLIRQGMEAQGVTIPEARLEVLFAAFLATYEKGLSAKTRPYPGVEAALDRLAAEGHAMAVCTNKTEKLARLVLRDLGLAPRFRAVCGQDTFQVSKPNGATLKLTVERAGGNPRHAIMIGDSATDVSTARDAGVPVIAVAFGYASEPVETLRPDRIISSFAMLPDAVASLAKNCGFNK